jgi:hypothetical protein
VSEYLPQKLVLKPPFFSPWAPAHRIQAHLSGSNTIHLCIRMPGEAQNAAKYLHADQEPARTRVLVSLVQNGEASEEQRAFQPRLQCMGSNVQNQKKPAVYCGHQFRHEPIGKRRNRRRGRRGRTAGAFWRGCSCNKTE